MAWIEIIPYAASTGRLRQLYDLIKRPGDKIDSIMACHSLRPHTMEGHMALYKYVMHHPDNEVPDWFRETLGTWVSSLNRCAYCVEQHFRSAKRLLKDDERAAALRKAIDSRDIDAAPLEPREKLAMRYVETLTLSPSEITESHVEGLRKAGYDDGEILEINQVAAYFAYANRTVTGLGCEHGK